MRSIFINQKLLLFLFFLGTAGIMNGQGQVIVTGITNGQEFCINDPAVTITASNPGTKEFFGPGITDIDPNDGQAVFDPAAAGVGTHDITYDSPPRITITVVVSSFPATTLDPFADVCIDEPAFALSGGNPAGGTYSGTGVDGLGNFDPIVAGPGIHTIFYTNEIGTCSSTDAENIVVHALPLITFAALPDLCEDAGPMLLTQATPAGGTYSGTGVSGGSFYPAVSGIGTFLITYTYDDGTCVNSQSGNITVNPVPVVSFAGLGASYCTSDGTITLTGSPTDAGGVFSGSGIFNNGDGTADFEPGIAGLGNHTIIYTYTDANSCISSASQDVQVGTELTLTGLNASYCADETNMIIVATPAGGTYSVMTGLSDNGDGTAVFDPSTAGVGIHTIEYTYNDGTCNNVITRSTTVYALPNPAFSGFSSEFCANDASVILTGNYAPGGSFSGAGILDLGNGTATFTPSSLAVGGPYSVTYAYTNVAGCFSSTTSQTNINAIPAATISGNATICQGSNTPIDVALTGASPFDFSYSNGTISTDVNAFAGALYNTNLSPVVNTTYTVTSVTDNNGCTNTGSGSAVIAVNPQVSITTHPTDIQACPGANTSFSLVAAGVDLTYQWQKDGLDIIGATNSVLTLNNIDATAEADYTCIVTSTCGGPVTSNAATLTLYAVTSISVHPADDYLCTGENLNLSVTAAGSNLSYQWYKDAAAIVDGGTITGAATNTLVITNVTTAQTGEYTCLVTGDCGSLESDPATIEVDAPIVITTQPTPKQACPGDNISFIVVATGTGLSYQWQKNGVDIPLAISQSLVLNNIVAGDAGNYRCVISSPCGAVINSAQIALTVNTSTSISIQPVDATECLGDNASFNITASGTALSYLWYKDGVAVADGGTISGAATNTLVISGLVAGDNGDYYCEVTGTCGTEDSDPASLSVSDAISITAQPVSQASCEGNNITYSVVANGSGLAYQWTKDGLDIAGGTNNILAVNSITLADAGNYRCRITNSCGQTLNSAIASLTVNAGTVIAVHPSDAVECVGNNINMTISATGSNLVYQWYKNAGIIVDGGDVTGSSTSNLSITNLDLTDAGTYYCQVSGDCGTINTDPADLTINDAVVINIQPADIQACDGDNVSFSVTATGSDLSYQWQKAGVDIAGATNNVYTISGIGAGDEANYRCVLTNSCGSSLNSNSVALSLYANTSIILQPVSQTECVAGNVSFTISALGDNLTYQWKKDGVNLADGGNTSGVTTNTLTISGIIAGDNGVYTCEVSGSCGILNSDPANLVLTEPTVILSHPASQAVCVGGNAVFSVSATGSNLGYQWQKNGVDIPGASNSGYIINNVTGADAGVFRCIVTGDCNSAASNGALLSINQDVAITVQPVSDVVCENEVAGFSVTATGAGLSYQWRHNGVDLADGGTIFGSNASNLTINPTVLADAGSYSCVVTGTCSNETSSSVLLTVNEEIRIVTNPQDKTACQGDNIIFNVSATGSGLGYQWQKDGADIPGATNPSLLLNNVAAADAGLYRCILTGICGTANTTAATLTVGTDVTISSQPADDVVCEGEVSGFTVTATGTGLTYQWKLSGVDMVDGGSISGATSGNLVINPAALSDAGAYVCEITGTCSTENSNPANLTVNENIVIGSQPANKTGCPGDDIVFNVIATGTNITYQWQKDGANLFGETGAGLLLNGIDASAAGVYRCEISGDCGVFYSTGATLTVFSDVNITLQPSDAITCEGNSEGFTVNAAGTGLTYQWKQNGIDLSNGADISGANTNSLSIDPADVSHDGVYTCEITGTCGIVNSNPANLVVNENIVVTTQPANLTSCIGETATFSVAVTGTNPGYQWQKDGVNLGGETNAGLVIASVTPADQGVYRCIISGDCGTVVSNGATLNVDSNVAITIQPTVNPVLCEGDNLNLTLTAAGSSLVFQWRKDGVDLTDGGTISGTNTDNLIISSIDVANDGIYTCFVTGTCGSVNSNLSDVVVNPSTTVLTHPVSYTIVEGGDASFSVVAEGDNLTYQWQLNGVNLADGGSISGATTSVLNLTGVIEADEGAYRCVVAGTCNLANSNPANLIVNPTSIITSQPSGITRCEGESAGFSIIASGTGNTYQWRKDGADLTDNANISGSTTAILTINASSLSDAGAYTCIVNAESSAPAILTVNQFPVIATQPIAATRCEGDMVQYAVIAAGSSLTYQWQLNGTDLADGGSISGSTTPVLTISATSTADAGNYRCVVTGVCGTANSDPAALTVNSNTAVTVQPTGSTICEGSSQLFNITTTGSSLIYQWKKNGVDLLDGVNISGSGTANLSVSDAGLGDAGAYTCEVTGSCGTSNSVIAQLFVEETTAVTLQPVDATACTSDNINFSILAGGDGLTYQWQQNGVDVSDGGAISGSNTPNLSITGTVPADAGSYVCVVTGNCGTENSDPALLTSYATTLISSQPTGGNICEGQTITPTVVASGDNLTYQWRKGGVDLVNGANITGVNTASLNIANATLSDDGSYSCVISGSCGTVISNLVTIDVRQTAQITTHPVDVSGCTGDNVSFSVVAQGSGLSYQWQMNGVDLSDGGAISGTSTSAMSVTGIVSGDAGSYRCVVTGTCNSTNSNPATLSSYNNTAITVQPAGTTVCENSPVSISVTATGDNLLYQWYADGVMLADNANISGSATSILGIGNITLSDEGTYSVVVSGECGNENSSFAPVVVDAATTILTQPVSVQGCEGDNVSFVILAAGENLSYQWQRNGVNLVNGGTISGAASSMLTISGIVPSDDGSYRCVVTGNCGIQNSNAAILSSYANTQITSQPTGITICEGSQIALSLISSGSNLAYQWKKDGVNLSDGGDITGSATASLIINNSVPEHEGIYTCFVSGSCGTENSSPASVAVREGTVINTQPQSLETCEGDVAVFTATATGESVSYQWQKDGAPLADGGNVFGSSTNILTLTNLLAADAGTYRCVITGTCGTVNSDAAGLSVNVYPSAAGLIVGPANVCQGDTNVIFEIAGIANAESYIWNLPVGVTIISGDSTRLITTAFSNNELGGNITVSGYNMCGTGPVSPAHIVTANAIPDALAGADQNICTDNTTLEAIHPGTATGTWSVLDGPATVTNVNLNNSTVTNLREGTNTLIWTVSQNGCSSADTVVIRNNNVSVEAGTDVTICSQSITLEGNTPPAGASGSWSVTSGVASFVDGSNPVTQASNFAPGINILRWTIVNGNCSEYDSIVVDNQAPTQASAGIDQSLCATNTILSANLPAIGTGNWTVRSGSATFSNTNNPNASVTNLGIGNNILRWTISNGICSSIDETTVTNNNLIVNAGVDQVLCDRTTTLDATAPVVGVGNWSVIEGSASFVNNNQYNTIVTGLAKGLNRLAWNINNNGCISSDTVSLTNNSPTTANAGTDQVITSDITTLQANIPAVGTGSWSLIAGAGTLTDPLLYNTTVSGLALGENTFRWTISYNSCISYDEVIVNNFTPTDTDAGTDQTLCSDETVLAANEPVFGFGEWSVIQGSATFTDNNDPNTTVRGLASGDNILRWTVWQNGYTYDDVVITNHSATVANAGGDQSLCSDSTALASNNPLVGSGKWTVISGAGTFENDTLYGSKVYNMAKGQNIFKWTITNQTCTNSDNVIITNNLPTAANAGTDQSLCTNIATLSPNTPTVGTGTWSVIGGSAIFTGNTATQLASGDNILRWTIANNGCELYDEITVTNNTPSAAQAGANKTLCVDSVALAANSPVIGTGGWTIQSGSANIADASSPTSRVTDLAQGINVFRWTITNNGCTTFDEVVVTNSLIEAIVGPDQNICSETTVLEANNPPAGTGQWSVLGGSGSAQFDDLNQPDTRVFNLDKGANILRWTIVNDICESYADVTITNNKPTDAFAGPDIALCDDSTGLQANTPLVGTGEWTILSGSATIANMNNPQTVVTGLQFGVNTLQWTISNNGCNSSDQVVVANNSTIVSNAGTDVSLCADSTVLYGNNPPNGIGQWSVISGSATFVNNNDYNTKVVSLGQGTNALRWLITNGDCSSSDEVQVTNNSPTKAIAGADQTVCGDSTSLFGNIPSFGAGQWVLVSGAAVFEDATDNNTSVTNLNPGNNTLRWEIQNLGCVSYDDVRVTNDLPYVADAGSDMEICSDQAALYANLPGTGSGQWSVISGSGTFDNAGLPDANISGLGFGNNKLRWSITYANCTTYDDILVINNKTDIYAGIDQTIGTSSTLLAANNPTTGSGRWSVIGGSGTFATPSNSITTVSNIGAGLNTYRWAIDINGCISYDDVSVTYNVPPQSSFVLTADAGCPPLEVYFINNSMDDLPFVWDFGDGTNSTEVTVNHVYPETGEYTASLTVYGNYGEVITKDTTITVFEMPDVSFLVVNQQVYIPEEEALFINTSQNSVNYQWEFGDGATSTDKDPRHIYDIPGFYDITLHAWTENQCYDSVTQASSVEVLESGTLTFPNAFTPSLDGSSSGAYNENDFSNDVFFPIGDGVDNYKLEIFNKWGIMVFESNDIYIGWDGYYEGELLEEGVYIWKVTGRYNNGREFKKVGSVLLIR